MESRTRVYPAKKPASGWLSAFLLLISLILLVSGVVYRNGDGDFSIHLSPTETPVPMDAAFDETPAQKEIVLPASQWYALQLGAFEDAGSAGELARQFVSRGAGGYVWQDGRYRVLAAVYPLREDAQLVRQQLETQHGIDSYLYEIKLPQIQVRLSGMQGQLDILEAAFVHANDLITRLQVLSIAMDRREASAQEAFETLSALSEQVKLASLRLSQRFASPRHLCVDGLIQCFDEYSAFCQQLDEKTSAVSLGADIKRQTLAALYQLKQVYDTLGYT